MRSITLIVQEEKKLTSYNFFRIIGMDDESATYRLVNNDEGGFKPLKDFEGTMQQNAQNLLRYFHFERGSKIIRVTGDEELGSYMQNLIKQSHLR